MGDSAEFCAFAIKDVDSAGMAGAEVAVTVSSAAAGMLGAGTAG
ncbi:MAG: hypothetical protein PUF51_00350 [Bifidobacteriaceae bacterium]|nr:hypothetical protein [Bifidobacteriaceae bacterium]